MIMQPIRHKTKCKQDVEHLSRAVASHSVHCVTQLYNTIKGRERGGMDEVHREVGKEQKTVRGKAERK